MEIIRDSKSANVPRQDGWLKDFHHSFQIMEIIRDSKSANVPRQDGWL